MTADKKARAALADQSLSGRAVFAGITADMYHGHAHLLTVEYKGFREPVADIGTVDIAPDPAQGFEALQLIDQGHRPEIPGMPDLIHPREMVKDRFVEVTMGV
jgi:hypothetical protein